MEAELSGSSICNNDQDELLKSAKAKMGEVKEENERLKKLLAQIVKQYQSLEKQISTMAHSKDLSSEMNNSSSHDNHQEDDNNNNKDDNGNQEPDLISLTLGSWSSKNNNSKKHSCEKEHQKASDDDNNSNKRRKLEGGELELGLDDYCKIEHTNPKAINTNELIKNNPSMEIANQDQSKENIEAWTTTKASRDVKEKENISGREDDDQDSLHQPQVKKTRVCIRSRCDSPTIHDGCHWRKYGQKIAKGNPCPRAYYRCTVSPTCPVRKQVQRCPHDMSILITTYEGTHNHPLPLSATAMASATSAAAAMIKTNSLTSQTPTLMRPGSLATSSLGLHTSSLMSSFNNNPSLISASSHNSHPTVTLDLTLPNSGFTSFDWLSSSSYNSSTSSRNSSFLNFSSSAASSSLPSLDFSTSSLPTSTSWANGYLLPYNNTLNNNNNNAKSNGNNGGYQNPSMNNNNNNNAQQQSLNETIAAVATKAIASNPNFQSVLAAAISSYVGTNNNKANNDQKNNISSLSSSDSQSSEGGRSLTLFPTSTPLSTSKGNASLAAEARDHSG